MINSCNNLEPIETTHVDNNNIQNLRCLFVGGPMDGHRINVMTHPVWVLYDQTNPLLIHSEYHREWIVVEKTRWTIYRYANLTLKDAIQIILCGYRQTISFKEAK